jgi:hydroxymethylbilane synthase
MMKHELKIGTRASQLALYQANWVRKQLMDAFPDLQISLTKIKTTGDRIQDAPLAKIGGKGLFVKEIEEALLKGRIDLAVHSIKDVPAELPAGLHLAAITEREDPRDVFISREGRGLKDLAHGANIGTSSLRRQAQLLHFRRDLVMVPLRGNVETRLKKMTAMRLDGIVLASAGMKRMQFESAITETIPTEVSLPAVGQGALGIETRIGDPEVEEKIRILNHDGSSTAVCGERAFLKRLGGGCQVPIAGFGRVLGSTFELEGMVGRVDGTQVLRDRISGPAGEAESLGTRLAELLLNRGAAGILDEIYNAPAPAISIDDRNDR